MKPVLVLVLGIVVAGLVALSALPFLVTAVIAGQLQEESQLAAAWDLSPEVVPVLQAAGQRFAVPWFLLAGVASAATDFARHAPDGRSRGDTPGTAIFPVVAPAIGHPGAGEGMFLVDRVARGSVLGDPQDVRAAVEWLAAQLAALARGDPLMSRPLSDPDAARFWQQLLPSAPLLIGAPAPGGADLTPVDPGASPIRQFGAAVLVRIGAPVTGANLDAFAAWAAGEGTCAAFNPLATTQPEPGATPFNTLTGGGHVWNYPSFDVGVKATTTALTNGRYRAVIAAFQASAGAAAVAAAVEASPWGTRHFGSPRYGGRNCPGGSGSAGGGPSPETPLPLPTLTGPDAVPATILARAIRYQAIWTEMVALSPDAAANGS